MEKFISKSLIQLRKSKKYTQTQFGRALGMSRSKVSSWEVGRRDISVADAVIICDYFQISLDSLLNPGKITGRKVISLVEGFIRNENVSEKEKGETLKLIEEAFGESVVEPV